MTAETQKTDSQARIALQKYIQDVRNSIPPGSGLAGIEAAMMQHNPTLLLEIMQNLDAEQGISPPRKAKTRKSHQNR
jgi:hypothetical protein